MINRWSIECSYPFIYSFYLITKYDIWILLTFHKTHRVSLEHMIIYIIVKLKYTYIFKKRKKEKKFYIFCQTEEVHVKNMWNFSLFIIKVQCLIWNLYFKFVINICHNILYTVYLTVLSERHLLRKWKNQEICTKR